MADCILQDHIVCVGLLGGGEGALLLTSTHCVNCVRSFLDASSIVGVWRKADSQGVHSLICNQIKRSCHCCCSSMQVQVGVGRVPEQAPPAKTANPHPMLQKAGGRRPPSGRNSVRNSSRLHQQCDDTRPMCQLAVDLQWLHTIPSASLDRQIASRMLSALTVTCGTLSAECPCLEIR